MAIKPFIREIPQKTAISDISSVPPYPDRGANFAGFAKVLGAGGIYSLKPQFVAETRSFNRSGLAASTDTRFHTGRIFYMSWLQLQHGTIADFNNLEIFNFITDILFKFRYRILSATHESLNMQSFYFFPPLVFPNQIALDFRFAVAVTERFNGNYGGYFEEI